MFETRIRQLQNVLSSHEIDALLITSSYNIAYLTGINAFSIEEREAFILLTKKSAYLFTDARYTEMVKQKAPFITLFEISYNNRFSKLLQNHCQHEGIKQLGFEEENVSYKEIADLEEKINDLELIPTTDIVENLRITKDKNEVELIKNACQLSDMGYDFILSCLKPGVSELEIKLRLENFIRENKGDISFPSIVAFGQNSAIPHHMPRDTKLEAQDTVLLDFGAKWNGYCSDMTRTVFIGVPKEKLSSIYTAVKEAQEIALDYLSTHMKEGFDLKKAANLANSHLKVLGFPEIPHGLGHGVGLQVHEMPSVSPFSEQFLAPRTVITVEPGIYIPNLGGVRIEDTILVTSDGVEILTNSPKELTVL